MMTAAKLGQARFMHCLPVRRNVVVEDAVLDGPRSLVLKQAANRTVSAQLALMHLLGEL
jgi:N-succinyl-L-ornithine transcarbamylase